jgi:hypothetical protein
MQRYDVDDIMGKSAVASSLWNAGKDRPRPTGPHLPFAAFSVPATLVADAGAPELRFRPGLAAAKFFVHLAHLELARPRSDLFFQAPLLLLLLAGSLVSGHGARGRVVA